MKPLVLSDIRSRAGAFVANWRDAEGYEKGEAPQFVRDLLHVFGISHRTAATYEHRARRSSTGRHGFIDALISGTALIEMKSAGEDLHTAETQALDYIESLTENERPDFIITSDFFHFRLLDLTAEDDETEVLEFTLEELPAHVEDLMFLTGYRRHKFGSEQQAQASIHAAQLMAKLYEHLEKTGYDDHQSSIFLIRTLFCLYADDAGLWERDIFSRYIEERTAPDGSDLGAQLANLFQALNKPVEKRYAKHDELLQSFPYVNGAVFGESVDIPAFDRAARDTMLQAAYFNWSTISPAIFGSLFQAVKDKKARRALGEHYTTEANILKLIRPLFLDELEAEFTRARTKPDLERLRHKLANLHLLDPAAGCGNFLLIAYRELRALDLKILEKLQQMDKRRGQLLLDASDQILIKLNHFHGIELEEWPATIARTAMFLVEHQANQAVNLTLGQTIPMLPLQDVADIHVANALRTNWADIVTPDENLYILGNPPFLGDSTREKEQLNDLHHAWGGDKQLSRMDYVTGWHGKTLELFKDSPRPGQWAFVTTNSITQGDQVPRLFSPILEQGWRIKFAHRTFAWSSEAPGAAAVHCTIIGFTKDTTTPQRLFDYPHVKGDPHEIPVHTNINPYLLDSPNILIEKRSRVLSPELTPTTYGSKPTDDGNFIIEPEQYNEVMADPIAAKYVHRYVGAKELLHGIARWCLWLEHVEPGDINRSPILKKRVNAVREFRQASKAASTRNYPHHHLFRQLAKPQTDFIGIPIHVSETRRYFPVAFFDPNVVASNATFLAVDPDGFQFSIMSSSMFIAWQKAIGGRIKSDLRFASTLTWYTLPLPATDPELRKKICAAGKKILDVRAQHPERTLAEHYPALGMDPELVKTHDALDRLVDKAFGATRKLTTTEARLALLFANYESMTSAS